MPAEIKFEALYQPNRRKFCVSVKLGARRRIVERMTIAKFIRWARAVKEGKPIVINGITVVTDDDNGPAMQQVRDYFMRVAQSYIDAYWGKPETN